MQHLPRRPQIQPRNPNHLFQFEISLLSYHHILGGDPQCESPRLYGQKPMIWLLVSIAKD